MDFVAGGLAGRMLERLFRRAGLDQPIQQVEPTLKAVYKLVMPWEDEEES